MQSNLILLLFSLKFRCQFEVWIMKEKQIKMKMQFKIFRSVFDLIIILANANYMTRGKMNYSKHIWIKWIFVQFNFFFQWCHKQIGVVVLNLKKIHHNGVYIYSKWMRNNNESRGAREQNETEIRSKKRCPIASTFR